MCLHIYWLDYCILHFYTLFIDRERFPEGFYFHQNVEMFDMNRKHGKQMSEFENDRRTLNRMSNL